TNINLMKKYRFLLLVPVAGIVIVVALNYNKLDLISGFSAKSVASAHFISGRDFKMIEDGDNDIDLVRLSKNVINTDEKSVTSTIFGLNPRTAVYRDGLGAVLIDEQFDVSKPYLVPKRTIANSDLAFPYGNSEPTDTI